MKRRATLWILLLTAPMLADSFEFFGNHYFSVEDLQEVVSAVLPASTERALRRSDVDDAAYAVERLYRREGFCFAKVSYTFQDIADVRFATLVIQEGPQAYIAEVQIEGVEAFAHETIRATFFTHRRGVFGLGRPLFRQAALEEAAQTIQENYIRAGYRNVVVETPWVSYALERTPDASGMLPVYVGVAVEEGTGFIIKEVAFPANGCGLTEETRKAIQAEFEQQPAVPQCAQDFKNRVLAALANRGYLRPSIEVDERVRPDGATLLTISESGLGPRFTVGEVRLLGLENTEEDFVRRRLKIEGGQTFSNEAVDASSRALFETGLFRTVYVEPTAFGGSDTVDVVFQVKEAARREIRLSLSGGSLDIVRGGVEYFDRNLLGTGLPFTIGARVSFIEAGVESSISYPHFLDSDWEARLLGSYIQTNDTPNKGILERNETLVELRFSHVILRHFVLGLGARFRRVNNFEEIDDITLFGKDLPDRYNTISMFAAIGLDTREPFFFPDTGWVLNLSLELGGSYFGSEVDFFRAEAAVRRYFGLGLDDLTLALRGDIALAIPTDNEPSLPIPERLFSGGHDSVRSFKDGELGFREGDGDPVGGEVRNTVGAELRYRLLGNLYLAGFAEAGNVAFDTSEAFEDFRLSLGVGVRYGLPIGPLRFDVGFNPAPRGREGLYRVHFNIGQAF